MPMAAMTVGAAVAGKNIAKSQKRKGDRLTEAQNDVYAARNSAAEKIRKAAGPDPHEIQALEASLKQQEQVIAREAKLIEAVDPAIMEAGSQAYKLLKGEEAATLGPIQRQRARQRDQLRETLRRQLGPGFETSTAGIEAMGRFDTQTSDVMANAQQNAVGQLLQVSQNAAGLGRSAQAQATAGMTQIGGLFGQMANRGFQGEVAAQEYTNANYADKLGIAQKNKAALGKTFSSIAGFAGTAAGFALGGPAGASIGGGVGKAAGGMATGGGGGGGGYSLGANTTFDKPDFSAMGDFSSSSGSFA